jgi:hypothetical protein
LKGYFGNGQSSDQDGYVITIDPGGGNAAFSASSRPFDLNGEIKRFRKRQSSAIITADV